MHQRLVLYLLVILSVNVVAVALLVLPIWAEASNDKLLSPGVELVVELSPPSVFA